MKKNKNDKLIILPFKKLFKPKNEISRPTDRPTDEVR